MTRRGLTTLYYVLLGAALTGASGWALALRDGTTVAPYPAPHHVEWVTRPAGGLVLLNPALTDSLGIHPALVLPPGTIISVPHDVPGDDPGGA